MKTGKQGKGKRIKTKGERIVSKREAIKHKGED